MSRLQFSRASASLPVAMSSLALALIAGHYLIYGRAHGADEGAAAHIFQWLMVGQIPIVAFFAYRWVRPAPERLLPMLGLQLLLWAAAVAAVPLLT